MDRAARLIITVSIAATAFAVAMTARTTEVHACGCFAPPDPSVPIVQAGERIVFEAKDGQITAHIQIQYSGEAADFAWLVPLPAIPELGVGTTDLFDEIIDATQPKYSVNYSFNGNCPFDPNRGQGGAGPTNDSAGGDGDGDGDGGEGGVLIEESAIGPYDFAILSAADKDEMLTWLTDNGYFVPTGTEDVVAPYIRPDAYFLAIKLQSGKAAGDIQPLVVTYEAEKPQVPIELTAVGAERDMGVQIFMLGNSRAIPKNYYHTIINDAQLDWFAFGANYADVVTNAVDEAEGHHSFVTEYAGPSNVMEGRLMYEGRFGDPNELRGISDPVTFISYMNQNGYPTFNQFSGAASYSSETLAVLAGHLPIPPQLAADGILPAEYYFQIDYWLGFYREQNPEKFTDADLEFDPDDLTTELQERVIDATIAADDLFKRSPYLTRLFTTLSPNEMVKDPVFSYNPDLADVSNEHTAEATYYCGLGGNSDPSTTPISLVTEQNHRIEYPEGNGRPFPNVDMPWSYRIEVLREEGPPETIEDNSGKISSALDVFGGGCSVAGGNTGAAGGLILILGVAFLATRRRRKN